jgi:hypothetical protein
MYSVIKNSNHMIYNNNKILKKIRFNLVMYTEKFSDVEFSI